MKKIILLLSVFIALLSSCKKDESTLKSDDVEINVTEIAIEPDSLSLLIDNTQQLTASVSPTDATDLTVSWSSSNPEVATVSTTGLVTGVSVGEAIITATVNDGSGITSTLKITIYNIETPIENKGLVGTWLTDSVVEYTIDTYEGDTIKVVNITDTCSVIIYNDCTIVPCELNFNYSNTDNGTYLYEISENYYGGKLKTPSGGSSYACELFLNNNSLIIKYDIYYDKFIIRYLTRE